MSGFICIERLTYGPWAAFERTIARLAIHSGFENVEIVGGPGDQGADIVGTKQGKKWVFQAKFRTNGGVGKEAAEEAIRALGAYAADIPIAVSNSYFYKDAYLAHTTATANGIPLRLWHCEFLLKSFAKLGELPARRRDLRDYQEEAVAAVEKERSSGRRRALIVMATGLGKTVVANRLICNEIERNPRQEVLVLAHMTDLVRQLEQSSWSQLPKSVSTHLWTDGERPTYPDGVIFATWQSLMAAQRAGEDFAGRFGLVVVDEAHHAPSAAFSELLQALTPNFVVGMTATPWRSDDQNLEDTFGPPCFTMDIVDGMQRGFLSRVEYQMLTDGIDWDEVSRRSRQGLTVKDLNQYLIMPDRDAAMVEHICSRIKGQYKARGLAFCRSISHAEKLQPLFAANGLRAAVLHSQLDRRQRFDRLSGFRIGSIDLLISIEMMNEGIDVPDVNFIAFMRVTHSRRIFLQQLGRGLRLSPGKGKVVVLDFVADIRRIAAGIQINRDALGNYEKAPEIVRYHEDGIIHFDNIAAETFFDEYIADVADIENMEDGARLRFPGDEAF